MGRTAMTSSKIEDVARAMYLHEHGGESRVQPWSDKSTAEYWRAAARVAIEALPFARYEEALRQIAAFDDARACQHLEQFGTYGQFDEPGSVQIARKALRENVP